MRLTRNATLAVLIVVAGLAGTGRRTAAAGQAPGAGRPAERQEATTRPGVHPLRLELGSGGLLYVPEGYTSEREWPLILAFHGASGLGESMRRFFPLADEFGVRVLAPSSRAWTWDGVLDDSGPDLEFIAAAVEHTLSNYAVDFDQVGMAGLSDGASYTLSLGLGNGDVFGSLMASSPGVMTPLEVTGKPRIFISHGTADRIMPIADTGRKFATGLRNSDYDVTFREFDGGHGTPTEILREAFEWFLSTPGP